MEELGLAGYWGIDCNVLTSGFSAEEGSLSGAEAWRWAVMERRIHESKEC